MLDLEITEINDSQASNAKVLASALSTPQIRKRGMIDILGINCAISYLQSKNFRIDTRRSVYKIAPLFEEFKITDIYYGGYRIDVITLYKEKTVKIPKLHADIDIMPNFYFVVQIGSKIQEAKMVGFIDAKSVLASTSDSKYFYPSLDSVLNLKQFSHLTKRPLLSKNMLGKHIDCLSLFLKFIDNDLPTTHKKQLIQHLMNCESCRARFIEALEFEKIASSAKKYPSLIKKFAQNPNDYEFELKYENKNSFKKQDDSFYEEKPTENSLGMFQKSAFLEDDKKTDNFQLSKNFIETVFNEIPKIELAPIKTLVGTKTRRIILTMGISFFILVSFALIALKDNREIEKENNEITNFEEQAFDYETEDENYPDNYIPGEAKLLPKQKNIDEFTINQPISTKPVYAPNVSKVSWEAPESLVRDEKYTKFLQLVGKNVKLNLQNDLLLVNDIPTTKLVKIDIKLSSSIDSNSIKIVQSSGSIAIDKSIKKVINDTLKFMKPPSTGLLSRSTIVTLCIELN